MGQFAEHLFTTSNLRLVDDPREWGALADRMGVADEDVRLIHQVHGADVTVAGRNSTRPAARPQADIVLSDNPEVAIAVRVADCAPVLLSDRVSGAVGAAHAGWRGTVHGAAARAVQAMTETFGTDPRQLVAAIGPCLGPCCGEVGPEVLEQFRDAGHAQSSLERWFTSGPSGRPFLNLWGANRDQLERAGIPASQIHVAALCTKSHASLLHSYRAHGRHAGRMAAIIRARGALAR